MKKRNQTLKKQLKTPQKASTPLKKPLYGGFLPLTGPAHFQPHHFIDVSKMVGIVFL